MMVNMSLSKWEWVLAFEKIEEFKQRWASAIVSAAPEQVMPLYSPKALLKPTLSEQIRQENTSIHSYFAGTAAGDSGFLKKGITEVRFGEECVREMGNTVVLMGHYQFVFSNGESTKADYTFVLIPDGEGGSLHILAHHSSLSFRNDK